MKAVRASTFLMPILLVNAVYTEGVVSPEYSTIDFPHDQSYINTNQPTIIGSLRDVENSPVVKAEALIVINGKDIGTTLSDENGIYRFFLEDPLSDGPYDLSVFCEGREIGSVSHRFTIDTTAPLISITYPENGQLITDKTIVIRGTTEGDSMVEVFLDGDTFGSTCYADEAGNWSIEYDVDNGSHVVQVQATDKAGNQGNMSERVSFSVKF